MKAGTLNVYNDANIKFGSYEHPNGDNPVTTYGSLNVQNFTNDTNGGTLDFRNNHADDNNLGNVKLGSDIKVNIDFISSDLTTATGDTFTSNVNADLNWHDENSRTSVEMNNPKSRPEIITGDLSIQDYDTIYLGFPIWWGTAPKVVHTFLEKYDFSGKKIIIFATSGSSGLGNTANTLKQSVQKPPQLLKKIY